MTLGSLIAQNLGSVVTYVMDLGASPVLGPCCWHLMRAKLRPCRERREVPSGSTAVSGPTEGLHGDCRAGSWSSNRPSGSVCWRVSTALVEAAVPRVLAHHWRAFFVSSPFSLCGVPSVPGRDSDWEDQRMQPRGRAR